MEMLRSVSLSKKIYDKLLGDFAKDNNLTLNELRILMFLNSNIDSNIEKNIVDALGSAKSHVSMSVTNLLKNGYINKTQDEKDKKKIRLQLTDKATKIVESANLVKQEFKKQLFSGVTKEEIEVLKNVAKKIENNIDNYN